MCRKKTLQGCCVLCFGFGVLVGAALESWLLTNCAGLGLILLGLVMLKGR